MPDIATVSVVSSAAVALGTLAVNFIGGERQRKHEADLDFEKRVWDQKSQALFSVMEACRAFVDVREPLTGDNRTSYSLSMSRLLDSLIESQSAIDAFASTMCSRGLSDLIDMLLSFGVSPRAGTSYDYWMTKWMDSMRNDEYQGNGQWYLEKRNEEEEKAKANFAPDLDDLAQHAGYLMRACRDSVRRPLN